MVASHFLLSPAPCDHHSTVWFCECDYFRYLTQVKRCSVSFSLTALFHLAECPQDSPMFSHIEKYFSCIRSNSISFFCMYHICFILSSVGEYSGGLSTLAIVNIAVMNTGVVTPLWDHDLNNIGINGIYYSSSFNFWGSPILLFHSDYNILYSHQQYSRVSVILHPHQHSSFVFLDNRHPDRCVMVSHCDFDE